MSNIVLFFLFPICKLVQMKPFSFIFLIAAFFTSCEFTDGNIDGKTVKEELRHRRIQRLTEGEILEKAMQMGDEITSNAQKTLITQLSAALAKGGTEYAIPFCKLSALNILDSLGKPYQATIRRVSHKARNPIDKPDTVEAVYLDGYLYNLEQKLPLEPNVQVLRSTQEVLYTAPIMLSAPLCLQCHGNPETEINTATLALLKTNYPQDQAIGFKLNEFRGMWSITMSRKELVMSLQKKK